MKHIKTVYSKGKAYAYFNTGERKASGEAVYAALPQVGTAEFDRRYAELLAERAWREAAPATIGHLLDAYQASEAFKRLSSASQTQYALALRPLGLHASGKQVDALTAEHCAEIAQHHGTQGTRTAFLKAVTRLYNWARRERFSKLPESPAEGLVVKRERVLEWIYIIGSGPNDPLKIGRARNIAQRLHNIQSGNPLPLRLLASFLSDNPSVAERNLHHKFHAHRLQGEWFSPAPEIFVEIERLQS